MAGERVSLSWSLVFLVGLLLTHYVLVQGLFGVTETMALWVWLALVIISTYHIGKSMGKVPAESMKAWSTALVLFVVLVGSMLLGIWGAGPGTATVVFFALYFVLFGGAMFASGHDSKRSAGTSLGLIYVVLGIVFPGWFGSVPFLAAALLIGIPPLLNLWKK